MMMKFRGFLKKSLAFVAGFKRATDEGSLPDFAQYSPYFLPLNDFTASKGSNFYILFAITVAGVVPCGGPKKSPCTSSMVQIIFSFRSFEISNDIHSVQKLTFRNILLSSLKYLIPFWNVSLI